ncbi:Sensor histidine kinase GlrK [Vibrio aerogenes CECT 7868]|uniref:histidine kinase n=1 Tax=Vibrio aerogenes CECT 7868 TaxID=1216006 RepID=A0A1M5Y0Y7_9VIBR|nr:HAMP domain-containing sensor histidine kinase [Vibrio aerogenes]SHI05626.1 Sensor histidine kinase GlrK [Vibrio aerogenes CECT 7868]
MSGRIKMFRKGAGYSLKRELAICFMLVALFSVVFYSTLLVTFFDRGVDTAINFSMVLNARKFAHEYEKNPDVQPSSFLTDFYFDSLEQTRNKYGDLFAGTDLKPGEYAFFEPPDDDGSYYYVIYHLVLHDGRKLYVVSNFDSELSQPEDYADLADTEKQMFYAGMGYLFLILAGFGLYSWRLGGLTQKLSEWVSRLTVENLNEKRPGFVYREFELVADSMAGSLRQNAALVEREKAFLSHASHELRTPLAVMRVNVEYLKRLPLPALSHDVIERLDMSGEKMQLIIETLLWLNRKNAQDPALERFNLRQVVAGIMSDLDYLTHENDVEVTLKCDADIEIELPVMPFHIVLSNLIRNAFQYTQEGWIHCSADHRAVVIHNCDTGTETQQQAISFGFGLDLTQQVCKRLGWQLDIEENHGGMIARLVLPACLS